ncbi:MAG TPA: ATP-binding protein, partial [Kofleriaceae bacterium]|nr:ATP-binding protein [Kofleriaceae bacterium]
TLEILTTRRRRSRLGYGQFAEVRFRDTGVGIPRDRMKKLFIPFYTTKSKGTGLGLAISQRIINQHGGTIEVRSTIGQGSTFSVFLPAADVVKQEDIKDITETGRLTAPMVAVRSDATPPALRATEAPIEAPIEAPTEAPIEAPTEAPAEAPSQVSALAPPEGSAESRRTDSKVPADEPPAAAQVVR